MKKTYFNTGVKPENCDGQLFGRQIWRGGVKQIPFVCDNVPESAEFMFACDNPDLPESKHEDVIVTEILDSGSGGMVSKYAYFRIINTKQ